MPLIDTVKQRIEDARERRPLLDHLVRTVQHFGDVNGSALAAAVTYFAFLSFFPIIALAFAVVGFVSGAYPNAERDLETAINGVLPGIVGDGDGRAQPGLAAVGRLGDRHRRSAGRALLRPRLALGHAHRPGRGLRGAGEGAAQLLPGQAPRHPRPAARSAPSCSSAWPISGVATKLATPILEFLGLGLGVEPLVWVLGLALGLVASTVLFFAFFRVLAAPNVPSRSLWSGALLGALAFEVLKQLSTYLLAGTKDAPAAQAFGIALILVVWMNYFSRVVVLAAAWAHTSPAAREQRERDAWRAGDVEGPQIDLQQAVRHSPALGAPEPSQRPVGAFAAGAATMLALVAVVRRRK